MFAAKADRALPKGYSDALLQIHDKRPFAATPAEIAELARDLRDSNFRIEVAEDGVHVYAKDFHRVAPDAMSLFASLGVEKDGAHAFYLGTELMKAETAFRLGKRYRQDEPLDFGAAIDQSVEDAADSRRSAIHCAKLARSPMPLIRECIVTTLNMAGEAHLAHWLDRGRRSLDHRALPPSTTLTNLEATRQATASFIDDAEIFAGSSRANEIGLWLKSIPGQRRASPPRLRMRNLKLSASPRRTAPRFFCAVRRIVSHRRFSA